MSSAYACSSIPVFLPIDPNALPATNGYLGSMAANGLGGLGTLGTLGAAGMLNLAMQQPTVHPAPHPAAGKRKKRRINALKKALDSKAPTV